MENKRKEVSELIGLIRNTDKSYQLGILMMTEAVNLMAIEKKKRRVIRRSRLELP